MNTLSYERGSLGRWAGTVLQETYRLGRQIYRSDTGETYEAGHTRLPGLFAIKIMHAELAANREAFDLFCREADVLSSLRHPHAPQIFDFSMTTDGLPYIVTEHLEGTTLGARLAVNGAMPLLDAARIVDAVASLLDAAHVRGIVHGRLHPTNVLLVHGEGQEATGEFVKVLDLGAAGLGRTRRSGPGHRVTPLARYQAPEQAMDLSSAPDSRTDQFALGALAYAMLTGRDPFNGDDPATLIYRIIHQTPPPLARYLSGPVARLQEVIDRSLAKDRAERFASAGELSRAFATAVSETLYRPEEPPPPLELSFEPLAELPSLPAPAPAPVAPPLRLAPLPEESQRRPARAPVTRSRALALALAGMALAGLMAGARYLYAGGALQRLGVLASSAPLPPPPALPPPAGMDIDTRRSDPARAVATTVASDPEDDPDTTPGSTASDTPADLDPVAAIPALPPPPSLPNPRLPRIPTLSAPPAPTPLPPPSGFLIIAPAEEGPGIVRTVAKH